LSNIDNFFVFFQLISPWASKFIKFNTPLYIELPFFEYENKSSGCCIIERSLVKYDLSVIFLSLAILTRILQSSTVISFVPDEYLNEKIEQC
jgi:hypothetical protein